MFSDEKDLVSQFGIANYENQFPIPQINNLAHSIFTDNGLSVWRNN